MISIWEVAKKVEKGQIVVDRPLDDWLETALAAGGLQIADMTRPQPPRAATAPRWSPATRAYRITVTFAHWVAPLLHSARVLAHRE